MLTSEASASATGRPSLPGSGESFVRHRGPVTCVAHIPGTRAAVTSCYDSAISYVDLDRQTIELMGYHDHLANRIVVDPQGTRAASCSSDYTVCLWDLATRRPERILYGHCDDVEDFAFVDANTGISVSRDHRIFVWNLATGAVIRVIDEHEKDVLSVEYADGKIYSSGDDMTLRMWDLATGKLIRMWGPFEEETDTCAIDPLHQRAILGADDGSIHVFDSATGELIKEIEAHASGIKKVAVSPVNGDILSAAYDQRILVWNADDLQLKGELDKAPNTWERSLNWSCDGEQILAGTFDGTVLVWRAADGVKQAEIGDQATEKGNACLNEISANAAGDIVTVSDDGYLRLGRLSPEQAEWNAKIEPGSGRVLMNAVTLDDEHGLVLAGAHDHKIHIFNKTANGLENEIEVALHEGPINTIRVAHNPGYAGESFVACYSGAIVRVAPNGEIRGKIQVHEGAVKSLRIHPDQPLGVSCGADGLVLSWKLSGELEERFQGHMAIVDDVDIDPAGNQIASVSRDFTVKVYDLASGKMSHSIAIGHKSPKSMCFWDSNTVIIGDYWGALLKVDLETERVTRHQIARNGLSSISRSGDYLVTTSYDGEAYLVQPEDLQIVNRLRAMHQRVTEETVQSIGIHG
ncbi:MAG: WD40 repeat domain-containing protein [Acidobacteriota bacterium]